MKSRMIVGVLAGAALLAGVAVSAEDKAATPAYGTAPAGMDHAAQGMITVQQNDVKWGDGPPALPPGVKTAVLSGDPSKEGPFVMRAKMPANYKVMPHFHPAAEHVTVISGAIFMGNGEKFDEKTATKVTVGGLAVMPPKHPHSAFTKGETVIQIHGWGPWGITYLNPSDDPRNQKKASTP